MAPGLGQTGIVRRDWARGRWWVLLLAAFIPFGSHVVRKSLGPLKTGFLSDPQWTHMSNAKFGVLLSATALPNLIVPVLGGTFLDTKGSRSGTMVFVVVTLVGQLLFTAAVHRHLFWWAVSAQIVTGMGAGSAVVSQASISSAYFSASEIGLAIGITESFHCFSNWIGQSLPALVGYEDGHNYESGLYLGTACCVISVVAAVAFVRFDSRAERRCSGVGGPGEPLHPHCRTHGKVGAEKCLAAHASGKEGACGSADIDAKEATGGRPLAAPDGCSGSRARGNWAKSRAQEGRDAMSAGFLGLAALHALFSTAHESFANLSANLLSEKYQETTVEAGFASGTQNAVGVVLAPLAGYLVDRYGHRLRVASAMAGLVIAAQLSFALTPMPPSMPLVALGLVSAAVPTIIRSSVPLVVRPGEWGLAFGLFEVCEATGTFSGNIIAGILRDQSATYESVNVAFAVLGLGALLLSLYLARLDACAVLALPTAAGRDQAQASCGTDGAGARTSREATKFCGQKPSVVYTEVDTVKISYYGSFGASRNNYM